MVGGRFGPWSGGRGALARLLAAHAAGAREAARSHVRVCEYVRKMGE